MRKCLKSFNNAASYDYEVGSYGEVDVVTPCAGRIRYHSFDAAHPDCRQRLIAFEKVLKSKTVNLYEGVWYGFLM